MLRADGDSEEYVTDFATLNLLFPACKFRFVKTKTISSLINILLFPSRKKAKLVYDFYFSMKPIAKCFLEICLSKF